MNTNPDSELSEIKLLDSLESEIDALSKIIDTKDNADMENDEVFNDIPYSSAIEDNQFDSTSDENLTFKDDILTVNSITSQDFPTDAKILDQDSQEDESIVSNLQKLENSNLNLESINNKIESEDKFNISETVSQSVAVKECQSHLKDSIFKSENKDEHIIHDEEDNKEIEVKNILPETSDNLKEFKMHEDKENTNLVDKEDNKNIKIISTKQFVETLDVSDENKEKSKDLQKESPKEIMISINDSEANIQNQAEENKEIDKNLEKDSLNLETAQKECDFNLKTTATENTVPDNNLKKINSEFEMEKNKINTDKSLSDTSNNLYLESNLEKASDKVQTVDKCLNQDQDSEPSTSFSCLNVEFLDTKSLSETKTEDVTKNFEVESSIDDPNNTIHVKSLLVSQDELKNVHQSIEVNDKLEFSLNKKDELLPSQMKAYLPEFSVNKVKNEDTPHDKEMEKLINKNFSLENQTFLDNQNSSYEHFQKSNVSHESDIGEKNLSENIEEITDTNEVNFMSDENISQEGLLKNEDNEQLNQNIEPKSSTDDSLLNIKLTKKTSETSEDLENLNSNDGQNLNPLKLEPSVCKEVEDELNSQVDEALYPRQDIQDFTKSEINTTINTEIQDPLSETENILHVNKQNNSELEVTKTDSILLDSAEFREMSKNTEDINLEQDDYKVDECAKSEDEEFKENEDTKVFENPDSSMQIEKSECTLKHNDFLSDEVTSGKSISESPSKDLELESAIKFLQKSYEETDSLPVEDNESIVEKNLSIFVSVEDTECDISLESTSERSETLLDPIAISEAEIISEAVKLENMHAEKLKHEQEKILNESSDTKTVEYNILPRENINSTITEMTTEQNKEHLENLSKDLEKVHDCVEKKLLLSPRILITNDETSELIEKSENLEKEPKTSESSNAFKNDQKIQKDLIQNVGFPEKLVGNEPKISDTPKKGDCSDKQQLLECENVGSPRIILKIAKSAITECSEPRSPKSPKIRSATNSPNPEDTSGHKLGKIKLKLSKSGHPSIISNNSDNYEETTPQWHTDNSTSEKPLGMKIKLTKSMEPDVKFDELQKLEELKEKSTHKNDECRKTEALKIKLSKSGDASIVQQDHTAREISMDAKYKENKETIQEICLIKKQESPPIGMKIKLSKTGDATIIPQDNKVQLDEVEDISENLKRSESSIGMKIKLSKTGDASVISNEPLESTKETIESEELMKRTDSPIAMKIKLAKTKDGTASIISNESTEDLREKIEPIELGMKIKFSKSGDASVLHSKRDDSSTDTAPAIGMKIKLSKTGDPSIIHPEKVEDTVQGVKSKFVKIKDNSQHKTRDDSHLEMKIKLSKTGHPTIISSNETQDESPKISVGSISQSLTNKDNASQEEPTIKSLKRSHSEVTIEPSKVQTTENKIFDLHNKRKEICLSQVETKKSKLGSNVDQMLPDITIQPITAANKEQQKQKLLLETNTRNISQQQMNVINEEISITQVCSQPPLETLAGDHRKALLNVQNEHLSSSPLNSDCEIIEPQPEFIIVNENSSSSQDIQIIDEVPPQQPLVKVPKKRGRPRRNAIPAGVVHTVTDSFNDLDPQRDPLSLDNSGIRSLNCGVSTTGESTERPKRTCRSQKSYAPPKRGRGRGRGKRKDEVIEIPAKKPRIDQDLTAIEKSTTAVISLKKLPLGTPCTLTNSPELFKALNQPSMEQSREIKNINIIQESSEIMQLTAGLDRNSVSLQTSKMQNEMQEILEKDSTDCLTVIHDEESVISSEFHSSDKGRTRSPTVDIEYMDTDNSDTLLIKETGDTEKQSDVEIVESSEALKDPSAHEHQNWLAPSIPKIVIESTRSESISTLTVIDEDTRMSAESGSRSQTPARNVIISGTSEPLNEESQGSVHSSATTESEKVKVQKNRRMEINFDPDEGPFTVEKIAEYEWPRVENRSSTTRGETFMIQEQISHYLGVKSFKRKYPDLKRRMVDMEERNYLRENGLVSESMCDMGLTAVWSSEVLDIMCSDFPEQYEEYRKYLREKAAKEHSKKQKELTAAANAERNRIDLAEMAMQSALSWNANFNKTRKESRNSSLDLQTFTVQIPKRTQKIDSTKRANYYPVALLPEQYTDYYKAYTPAELRYFPLNTVLYGPMLPNERKFYSQSEVSQSDSDSDSSSDDSSSSSSEGTQDTDEGSQSTMDEVDMELSLQSDMKCKLCQNNFNKSNRPEVLIQCGTCNGNVHPSCIDLSVSMVPHIRAYAWQCTDCKTCAQCHDPADEDKMLFCDMCDRGYHIYCVGLRRVPQGRWHCQECAVCANCGSKEPGGVNSDRNSVAQWQHEYKKADKNTPRVYVSTFCVPCSKLWRKGRYCPHCSRCHNAPRLDQEPNLVHCGACDKYLHLGCVEAKELIIDKKRYLCEFCSPNRQQFVKPLISKTFKT